MVKGVSKRVVVVRPPANEIFEEAIFIVRGDKTAVGHSQEDILREAYRVAEGYTHTRQRKKRTPMERIPAPLYAALGALCVGVAWIVTIVL